MRATTLAALYSAVPVHGCAFAACRLGPARRQPWGVCSCRGAGEVARESARCGMRVKPMNFWRSAATHGIVVPFGAALTVLGALGVPGQS